MAGLVDRSDAFAEYQGPRVQQFSPRLPGQQSRSGHSSDLLIVLGALLLALLFGIATVLLPPQLIGMAAAALLAPLIFIVWLQSRATNSRDWLFVVLLLGMLVLPLIGRVSGVNLGTGWQALILLLSLLGLRRFWADVRQSAWLRFAVFCFGAYLVLALASTLLGRSHKTAAAFQFVSDLKPLLLVALGYALSWDSRAEGWLWRVIALAWIPMALMVAFEWAAPGAFWSLTVRAMPNSVIPPTGIFPSRAISIFEHPSFLAGVSACFVVLIMSRLMQAGSRKVGWTLVMLAYIGLAVASLQRQELAGLFVGMLAVALLARRKNLFRNLVIVTVCAAAVGIVTWFAFSETIEREAATYGFGTIGPLEQPRAQIFAAGVRVASTYFPFGSGLGTFAGAGAEKFDRSFYYDLGFGRYWWFGKRDFLLDTYWPNPLGEAGVIGAGMLLLFYLSMLIFVLRKCFTEPDPLASRYWLAASSLSIYMLLLSLTSPAYQDPRLFGIPAILIGIASHLSAREKRHAN